MYSGASNFAVGVDQTFLLIIGISFIFLVCLSDDTWYKILGISVIFISYFGSIFIANGLLFNSNLFNQLIPS